MLKIVTDGGADMPDGWQDEYKIDILPLYIRFGEVTFTQGEDISPTSFYKMVETTKQIPHTSLPTPHGIVEFYRKIAKKDDRILSVHLSSKLSGTFAAVEMAKNELLGELDVYPFDSGSGSAIMGLMCREARILDTTGTSFQDILTRLEIIKKRITCIFTVDNLEFAYLNGRVNAIQTAISSILNVKPIIMLRDGLLQMTEKVRTRKRSIDRILEILRERVGRQRINIAVVHAADPDAAKSIKEAIQKLFDVKEIILTELSIPVAANLGPGTVGIFAYPVDGLEG